MTNEFLKFNTKNQICDKLVEKCELNDDIFDVDCSLGLRVNF